MRKYTYEEIKEHIKNNYSYLELTDKEIESYIKFIRRLEWYIENHNNSDTDNAFEYFQRKVEELYSLFKERGYSEKTCLILVKRTVTTSDLTNLITTLNFGRAINIEEKAIKSSALFIRKRIDEFHAKKAYLVSIGDNKNQTIATIIRTTSQQFEQRFNVHMKKLLQQFPITDELKMVWAYQAELTDEKLINEYGIDRQKLAEIYPTTVDELETVCSICKLTNEEVETKYGISKEELLKKHPINRDTLKALAAINKTSDDTVSKLFDQPKSEVLKLRTITTEMILLANEKIKLKRKYYSKEELKEKLMNKKRGAI